VGVHFPQNGIEFLEMLFDNTQRTLEDYVPDTMKKFLGETVMEKT